MSSNKVTRKMKKKYSIVERGSRGKQKEGWLNLRFKDDKMELKMIDDTP